MALQTRADFIFLDEPTLGHDAVSRELFYDEVLRIYREEENTILLSTHLIDEISNLLEEVIFIDHGRIVLEDSMENMMASYFYIAGPADRIREIEGSFSVIDFACSRPGSASMETPTLAEHRRSYSLLHVFSPTGFFIGSSVSANK